MSTKIDVFLIYLVNNTLIGVEIVDNTIISPAKQPINPVQKLSIGAYPPNIGTITPINADPADALKTPNITYIYQDFDLFITYCKKIKLIDTHSDTIQIMLNAKAVAIDAITTSTINIIRIIFVIIRFFNSFPILTFDLSNLKARSGINPSKKSVNAQTRFQAPKGVVIKLSNKQEKYHVRHPHIPNHKLNGT